MSTRNITNKKTYPFDVIWNRIKASTPVQNQKALAKIVVTSQSNISKRRSENNFPAEWAFSIAQEYNLNTDWIMTGEEAKSLNIPEAQFKNNMLHDVDRWLSKLIEEEPFRKEWFMGNFLDAFPTFARWKKSKEEEKSKDTTIQNKAA